MRVGNSKERKFWVWDPSKKIHCMSRATTCKDSFSSFTGHCFPSTSLFCSLTLIPLFPLKHFSHLLNLSLHCKLLPKLVCMHRSPFSAVNNGRVMTIVLAAEHWKPLPRSLTIQLLFLCPIFCWATPPQHSPLNCFLLSLIYFYPHPSISMTECLGDSKRDANQLVYYYLKWSITGNRYQTIRVDVHSCAASFQLIDYSHVMWLILTYVCRNVCGLWSKIISKSFLIDYFPRTGWSSH